MRAEIEVFGRYGLTLVESDCLQTKGLRVDDVVRHWHAVHAFEDPMGVETALVDRVIELVLAEGRALPGVVGATAAAKTLGPIALASSSPRRIIEAALTRLGLAFDVVQSAETEPYGKPHPAIFLRTAERLGVSPLACTVLEDSINGVIAAKAARMRCIAVPAEPDPRFALADVVVDSLEAVTADLLANRRAC